MAASLVPWPLSQTHTGSSMSVEWWDFQLYFQITARNFMGHCLSANGSSEENHILVLCNSEFDCTYSTNEKHGVMLWIGKWIYSGRHLIVFSWRFDMDSGYHSIGSDFDVSSLGLLNPEIAYEYSEVIMDLGNSKVRQFAYISSQESVVAKFCNSLESGLPLVLSSRSNNVTYPVLQLQSWSSIGSFLATDWQMHRSYELHIKRWKFCDREMLKPWDPGIYFFQGGIVSCGIYWLSTNTTLHRHYLPWYIFASATDLVEVLESLFVVLMTFGSAGLLVSVGLYYGADHLDIRSSSDVYSKATNSNMVRTSLNDQLTSSRACVQHMCHGSKALDVHLAKHAEVQLLQGNLNFRPGDWNQKYSVVWWSHMHDIGVSSTLGQVTCTCVCLLIFYAWPWSNMHRMHLFSIATECQNVLIAIHNWTTRYEQHKELITVLFVSNHMQFRELSSGSVIHSVFNVTHLRKTVGRAQQLIVDLPNMPLHHKVRWSWLDRQLAAREDFEVEFFWSWKPP